MASNPQQILPAASGAAVLLTYATWNPVDINDMVLSSGNLVAEMSITNIGGAVRATIGKSSGKWSWEITINSVDHGGNAILSGIGLASASIASTNPFPGSDANGRGYYNLNGNKYVSGGGAAYGATYGTGAVIGCYLDMDAGTLAWTKNGVSQGVAFSGLSGTYYPMCGGQFIWSAARPKITGNFGPTPIYAPLTGFPPGIWSTP